MVVEVVVVEVVVEVVVVESPSEQELVVVEVVVVDIQRFQCQNNRDAQYKVLQVHQASGTMLSGSIQKTLNPQQSVTANLATTFFSYFLLSEFCWLSSVPVHLPNLTAKPYLCLIQPHTLQAFAQYNYIQLTKNCNTNSPILKDFF